MSIENNIASLQSILTSVNELPEAGGGNSGVTVQRTSGSFTTSTSGTATVNCGFQPDIIIITGFAYTYEDPDYEYQACFCFPEREYSSHSVSCGAYSDTYPYGIEFPLARTSTGFTVSEVFKFDADWNTSVISRKSFNYVAIKYTA